MRHRVQVETARDLAVSRLGVDPTTRPDRRGLAVADRAGGPRGHGGRGVRRPRGRAGRHTASARVVPRRRLALRRRDGLGAPRPGAALRRPDGRARGRARVARRRGAAGRVWRCTSATCSSVAGRPTPSGSARALRDCRGRARWLGPLQAAVAASDWRERESGLVDALRVLSRVQAEVGLPTVDGSGRAVLGPALPGRACGCRRRGRREHHRPGGAGAAPRRRVGGAVERQRRRARRTPVVASHREIERQVVARPVW